MTKLICFWCLEQKGETTGGQEKIIPDYDPCDACMKVFHSGLCIFEVSLTPVHKGQPPMKTEDDVDCFPTGSYVVFSDEQAKAQFKSEFYEKLSKDKAAFMDSDSFAMFKEKPH